MEDEPLPWWKSECVWYPVLAKVAKKILYLCVTSVPSERVFSCGGNIVCDSRTCLKPQRVDSVINLEMPLRLRAGDNTTLNSLLKISTNSQMV